MFPCYLVYFGTFRKKSGIFEYKGKANVIQRQFNKDLLERVKLTIAKMVDGKCRLI